MKKRIRIFTAAFLSLTLFSGTAFASSGKVAGQKWVDSSVIGNVTAGMATDPKDDFALYVNRDWESSLQLRPSQAGASAFTEREDAVREQITGLITDGTDTSHEAELVSGLYGDYTDMSFRNSLGVEPVRPYIDAILKIGSMDELSRYISDPDTLPSYPFVSLGVYADNNNSMVKAVYVDATPLMLDDADEYAAISPTGKRKKAAGETEYIKFLGMFGIPENEARQRFRAMFDLEKKLASATYGISVRKQADYRQKTNNPVDFNSIVASSPNYPIAADLKPFADRGVTTFIHMEPKWLARLNELYTAEYLEAWKDKLLYTEMKDSVRYLNQDCLDIYDEYRNSVSGSSAKTDPAESGFNICSDRLDMAVGKMYADNCVDSKVKQDTETIIAEIRSAYRNRLLNESWLGGETRQKAVEKLDALTVRAAYPDDWSLYDYSSLNFRGKEQGGNLYEDIRAIEKFDNDKDVRESADPVDRRKWVCSPQTVNAFYDSSDNSINIPAGILGGVLYSPDAGEAANLGSIGMIIGHEITHGFDPEGSQFDKDGRMNNWWTDADRSAFAARTEKTNAFYSTFEPIRGLHVDGELTQGENAADLGGMATALDVAAGKENFDYHAFFESHATVWREQYPEEAEESWYRSDPHSPSYLRVNAVVQQFQEFYDTFGVTEGDNMYLKPEDRLSVW